jgi:hypothetical protein
VFVGIEKLRVAQSRNTSLYLWNPKFKPYFKSRYMIAGYSRKINAVASGIFATGLRKNSSI